MKKRLLASFAALGIFSSVALSHATLVGINATPLGTHGTAGIAYGYWDVFPSGAASFSNVAFTLDSTSAASNLTSGSLSLTGGGATLSTSAGDRYYDQGNNTAWSITAQTTFALQSVVLQVKLTNPASASLANFYSPTLNNLAASSTSVAATAADNSSTVVTYTWNNLSVAANTAVTVNFGNSVPQQHAVVDTVTLDLSSSAAPVPEPSSIALLAMAGGAMIWKMRRRGLV